MKSNILFIHFQLRLTNDMFFQTQVKSMQLLTAPDPLKAYLNLNGLVWAGPGQALGLVWASIKFVIKLQVQKKIVTMTVSCIWHPYFYTENFSHTIIIYPPNLNNQLFVRLQNIHSIISKFLLKKKNNKALKFKVYLRESRWWVLLVRFAWIRYWCVTRLGSLQSSARFALASCSTSHHWMT